MVPRFESSLLHPAVYRFFFAFLAWPGQQTGQLPGLRHLWPREQVFQPLDVLGMGLESDQFA